MRSRGPLPKPDILTVAQNHIGTCDQATVFDVLLDAAIRSMRAMLPEYARRTKALSDGVDKLLSELERSTPVEVQAQQASGVRMKEWRQPEPRLKK